LFMFCTFPPTAPPQRHGAENLNARTSTRKVDSQLQSRIRRHVPKDSFLIYNCVPRKLKRHSSQNQNTDIRPLLDSLVSALAVYAIAFRSKLSLFDRRAHLKTVRCLWFPTSDRLETWLILSGTIRSKPHLNHGLT